MEFIAVLYKQIIINLKKYILQHMVNNGAGTTCSSVPPVFRGVRLHHPSLGVFVCTTRLKGVRLYHPTC